MANRLTRKRMFLYTGISLTLLLSSIVFKTVDFGIAQLQVESLAFSAPQDSVVAHLQQAIRYRTVSYDSANTTSTEEFEHFHKFLERAFPNVHKRLQRQTIATQSLLFYWKGTDSTKAPIMITGHQDVVPVEEATLSLWKVPPFSGAIKDNFVWGRGAADDKGSLIAILESVEKLLEENYVPTRDIYLAFGHDEEARGTRGAKKIAQHLKEKNIKPYFVLDEGGLITSKQVPGISKPVALVGISEKGYVTLKLSVNMDGGHSAIPARETAITELSKAIVNLNENPFPAKIHYTLQAFMDYTGPHMPLLPRIAFANQWLLSSMIKRKYSSTKGPNASIRTTLVPTLFSSGMKENAVPSSAVVFVNVRTLPGEHLESVLRHVRAGIDNPRIHIEPLPGYEFPETVADVSDSSFAYLQQTIRSWDSNTIVAPFMVLGATDGRYYSDLTTQVFRFVPFHDTEGYHGLNERIEIEDYKKGIAFYYGLIKSLR